MTTLPALNYVSDEARSEGEVQAAFEATNTFIRDKFGSESVAISTVASAATVDLGAQNSDSVLITGNTGPVTSFGTVMAGVRKHVRTASNPTFTHSSALQCPGGVSFTASAGTTFEAESLGSGNWIIRALQLGTGVGSLVLLASGSVSAAATLDLALPSGYRKYLVVLDNLLPATNSNGLGARFSFDGGSTYKSASTDYIWAMTYWNTIGTGGGVDHSSGSRSYINVGAATTGLLNTANGQNSYVLEIYPGAASLAPTIMMRGLQTLTTAWVQFHGGGATTVAFGSATNIRLFFTAGGNISTALYAIYGVL